MNGSVGGVDGKENGVQISITAWNSVYLDVEMSLGSQQLPNGHLPQLHQDSMRQPYHLSQVFQEIRLYETKLLSVSVHDHVSSLRNAVLQCA